MHSLRIQVFTYLETELRSAIEPDSFDVLILIHQAIIGNVRIWDPLQ